MVETLPNTDSTSPQPSLIGLEPAQLADIVCAAGGKAFAAKQLAEWMYSKRITDFEAMTNLSKELRKALQHSHALMSSSVIAREESGEGTTKLALRLADGLIIEAVLMREADRRTACISTQAGCAMGCGFCASGKLGLKRHLTPGEILEQLYHIEALIGDEVSDGDDAPSRLTNVVVMGMGEPLHNFDGLMGALRALNAEWGFNFGARRITVSTVGLPDAIRRLAEQGIQFNLAISLHATTDEQRTKLIPTNVATGLRKILDAAAYYFKRTGREVTFEYTLVGGRNDSEEDAHRLLALLRDFPRANVNLIPMNPVEGSGLHEPAPDAVDAFTEVLRAGGVNTHVRRKRGRRVQAACGQLRLRMEAQLTARQKG